MREIVALDLLNRESGVEIDEVIDEAAPRSYLRNCEDTSLVESKLNIFFAINDPFWKYINVSKFLQWNYLKVNKNVTKITVIAVISLPDRWEHLLHLMGADYANTFDNNKSNNI